MKTVEELIARIEHTTGHAPRPTWDGWQAHCPAHDDGRASLSIARGDAGHILVKCHAGCTAAAIVAGVGWSLSDLSPPSDRPASHNLPSRQATGVAVDGADSTSPAATASAHRDGMAREVGKEKQRTVYKSHVQAWGAATRHLGEPAFSWNYRDRAGELVGIVMRWDTPQGKEIRPLARVDGGWVIGAMPEPRPIYHLAEVVRSAGEGARVFVVEGEKAADAGAAIGLTTCTSAGGSAAARQTDWSPLAGRDVVILPDNDEPGRGYGNTVVGQLVKLAPMPKIRFVRLPGLPPGGDIADWIMQHSECSDGVLRAEIDKYCEEVALVTSGTALANDELRITNDECKTSDSTIRHSSLDIRHSASLLPIATRLDECAATQIEWLWPGRIPLGKFTMLVGDPGLGKSFLTLDLAARTTRGAMLPGTADAPPVAASAGSVALLSAEDDVSDTIRPRLEAAGAHLTRVVALRAVGFHDEKQNRLRETAFSLASDLEVLEQLIAGLGDCRLVVIDPITAYLGSADSHNNAEMRSLLAPLSALAGRTGVAVLAINHLNKANQGPAIYRSMGSVAFAATARSALAVLADPYDPSARVLVSLKNNLAEARDGMRYRIVTRAERPVIEWDGTPVRLAADEIMAAAAQSAASGGATLEAADWLTDMLRSGPQTAAELKSLAKADGIHERTLLRAKSRLGLVSRRQGIGAAGSWVWQWPPDRPLPPSEAA